MRVARIGPSPSDAVLVAARDVIRAGGALVFPTDTVYGIGCDPENARAVAAIFAAKSRPAHKPLAIHVAAAEDAWQYATGDDRAARALAAALWPGPVTFIVTRAAGRAAPAALDGATIALRCPDDAACAAILRATGPLAATSANLSGETAFAGDGDARGLPACDLALIAGPTKYRQESTLLDCTTDIVRVLRAGALPRERIATAVAAAGLVLAQE